MGILAQLHGDGRRESELGSTATSTCPHVDVVCVVAGGEVLAHTGWNRWSIEVQMGQA